MSSPYKRARIFAFLHPFKDAQNTGFHIVQSLLALGSGGLFGVGLGETNWPTVDFVAFGVELPLQAVARTTSRAAIAAPFACLRPNTSRA